MKFLNLKQLIIDHISQRKMVYSVRKFLGLSKIMNVIVESTKVLGIGVLSVIGVELRLLVKK